MESKKIVHTAFFLKGFNLLGLCARRLESEHGLCARHVQKLGESSQVNRQHFDQKIMVGLDNYNPFNPQAAKRRECIHNSNSDGG